MQLNELRKIIKIPSEELAKNKWDFSVSLEELFTSRKDLIVSLGESQVLRWIDDIKGLSGVSDLIKQQKRTIRFLRKEAESASTPKQRNSYRAKVKREYEKLNNLQFIPEYVSVVMKNAKHYDRANKGFKINGVEYRRFLGTTGGVKQSTIVYVSAAIYPQLMERLDNGRNLNKAMVPAKLGAYQALACSASRPLPMPKGFIVVNDCITHFTDDVIVISDGENGEPKLEHIDGYPMERNNSDGFGLMLPSYSRRINQELNGIDGTISGVNTRFAYCKGMIFTFDFIEFAEKVAKTYEIVDAWGQKRDVRDAEVILTVSMLKLWSSYDSWEDYFSNCVKHGYQFSACKATPEALENVRTTNYQFLQSYQFSDADIEQLAKATVDEIKDVLGMDYRKSILFMGGEMSERKFNIMPDDHVKALMIEPSLISDPYVRSRIYSDIEKRIERAARGKLTVNGNYCIISGDPYALAESMFGLPIVGLLKAGEVYNKYWIDKGAEEVVCFRAPMTNKFNLVRRRLCKTESASHWFQYITTAHIYNAWDSSCDAMNGADFDSDTNLVTNDPILLQNTQDNKTIVCLQRNAEKVVPTEADIIAANKLAFNDDIGTITNYVTSMFEVQSGFEPDSPEYQELEYRIMCGQHFQQLSIDRVKGIIAEPMPKYWYSYTGLAGTEDDTPEEAKRKEYIKSIAAARKPYFMIYVYDNLRREYNAYEKRNNHGVIMRFGKMGIRYITELEAFETKTQEMQDYLDNYYRYKPTGENPCVVNRIAWLIESKFRDCRKQIKDSDFDYSILKSGAGYTPSEYNKIAQLYAEYVEQIKMFMANAKSNDVTKDEAEDAKAVFFEDFRQRCAIAVPNENSLCDIVLDICYERSNAQKTFAWMMCGDAICKNLLTRNNGVVQIPVKTAGVGEFDYAGNNYQMVEIQTF